MKLLGAISQLTISEIAENAFVTYSAELCYENLLTKKVWKEKRKWTNYGEASDYSVNKLIISDKVLLLDDNTFENVNIEKIKRILSEKNELDKEKAYQMLLLLFK